MHDLTIFTCVSGWYRDYAPLFEFCARKSYPDAKIVVDHIENPVVPYEAAFKRLLVNPGGEYVYVTDIDMMLHPGLVEPHLKWMKEHDSCYSNSCRGKGEPQGPQRMTGLHFCNQEWYARTLSERSVCQRNILSGRIGTKRFQDELSLYSICSKSGLRLFAKRENLPFWHFGIHMGTLRCYETHTRQRKNTALDARISPERARWWVEITEDPEWMYLVSGASHMSKRIKEQYEFLYAYARRRAKA